MESEDFAYPSNLASGPLHLEDEDDYRDIEREDGQNTVATTTTKPTRSLPAPLNTSFSPPTQGREGSSAKTSLEATSGSNHWEDQVDRGHFRANNVSTGSDLVQVTVEDLLISEEQVRTIKASNSYKKKPEAQNIQDHFQDQDPGPKEAEPQVVEPISTTSPPPSSPTSPTSPRSITITATLRGTNDSHLRRLSFETEGTPPNNQDQPKNLKTPTKPKTTATTAQPEPMALTPAQQREAEADANIQKAIELHENNQLVEATRYFRLAAQSENPLGQLMYGLSLRHGWGCRPNPTEAIIYLQRAAEFAMGELKELSPRPRPPPPQEPQISVGTISESQQPSEPSQQEHEKQRQQASKSSHTNLRRMGSLDRRQATVTARKELVMALYELGMSYLKGWGVHKDKSVAFTYFKIAADLGDPDSQNETAFCYYDGIGVNKDMFQSAKYYRLAAAQGASHVGNSWIWKPKYDQYCAAEAAAAVATSSTTQSTRPRSDSDTRTSRSRGSSKSRSSSPAPIATPQYTLTGIAAGLASVTAATTGAIAPPAYSGSIRESMSSPPAPFPPPGSSLPTSSSSSSITSLPTLASTPLSPVVPTMSRFAHRNSQSVGHLPLTGADSQGSPSPLAVQTGFAPSSSSTSSSLASPPLEGRKKNRWSLWGNKSSTTLVSNKAN
ncbi:hypothetical protein BGZ74_009575 [Mortierella antarctica]|nr:hypothetical protein BGZ74_009575 [Mortierella antarctica]